MFSTGFDILTTNTSPLDPVQELKALSLAEVGGGGGGVLFPSISHQIGTCMCCPKGYGFYAVSVWKQVNFER